MIHTCKKCGKQFEDDKQRTAVCYECRTAVCVVCGKRFIPVNNPQYTCSQKCSGIRKSQNGTASSAAKIKPKQTKICKFCGKEFLPRTFRQVYCDGPHYKNCPVCGKPVEVKDLSVPPMCCSNECKQKATKATCLEKYGNVNVLNSEYGKEKAKQSCLERYGVEDVRSTEEYKEKCKQTMLEKYGVEHALQNEEIKTKFIATNIERYGGASPMCSDIVKDKANVSAQDHFGGFGMASPILRERIQSTNLTKYGCRSPLGSESVKEKIKQTLREKYGSEYIGFHIPEIKAKMDATNLERYGTIYPSQSADIKERIRNTMQQKYGVSNIMELPEYIEKCQANHRASNIRKYGVPYTFKLDSVREKISNTFMEKYGVPWYTYMPECHEHQFNCISSYNVSFLATLRSNGLEGETEFAITYDLSDARHTYYYDIHVANSNILIEIDPTYTHNSYANHWGTPLPEEYHMRKTSVAVDNGYRCIHLFEWDDWDKVVSILSAESTIYARSCKVDIVTQEEADKFTERHHLQGKCRGQVCNYGLYYEDQLVQVMTFGKPRYNRKYDMELLRLCSISGTRVVGGASKLFHAFVKDNPDISVISYCNLAKFTGAVYEKIGMSLQSVSSPAKIWSKGNKYITDNLLRQRGYDQLFGTSYGKGTSNEELMLKDGWLPVYDCGQAVYVWESR